MNELSPLFQDIEFHERFRGYDPDEVDAYVDRVAKAAALAQGRLAELHERAEAAETRLAEGGGSETEETLRRTLVLAQRTADAAVAEAREEAARLVSEAEGKAQSAVTMADSRAEAQRIDAEERSTRLLTDAEERSTAMVADAEERSSRMVADAESNRQTLVAEAEAAAAGAASAVRDRLASEVEDLARTRDFLQDDIEILERHLREQRARLVSSVATLADLLDVPDSLQVAPTPATSGVEPPQLAPVRPPEAELPETEPPRADPDPDVVEHPEPVVPAEPAVAAAFADEFPTPTVPQADAEPIEATTDIPPLPVEASADVPAMPVETVTERAPVAEESEVVDIRSATDAPAPVAAGDAAVAAHPAGSADTIGDDLYDELIDEQRYEEPEPEYAAGGAAPGAEPTAHDSHEVIDLVAEERAAEDERVAAEETPSADPSQPSPPVLRTAADVDVEPGIARDSLEGGPVTMPVPVMEEASLFGDVEETGDDPFLNQLRDAVTSGEPQDDDADALSAFFDQDDDENGRSWFGRRR